MIYDLSEITGRLQANPEDAIAQWEADYTRQLYQVEQLVKENRAKTPVVLLTGPSASSKTTTGQRLRRLLIAENIPAHLVSMDNYYLSWSDPDFPLTSDGQRDLESPDCLDIPLLNEHFAMLEAGEPIDIPIYHFPSHSRLPSRSIHLDVSKGDVFIFEGIHALNELFTNQHPEACRLYVSPASSFVRDGTPLIHTQQLRLMRRIVRDYQTRGATAEFSLQLWANVLSSEKIYITPHRAHAHGVIDTTLGYELHALQPFIIPLLHDLPCSTPGYELAADVLSAMQDILPLDPRLVPEHSILREFIGSATIK